MLKKKLRNMFRHQRKSAGFTLIELLISVAIGWIVISGLIYFVVQLLRTDQQEFARTETEREMSIALDYITSELKEAVYVYEGECLGTNPGRAVNTANYCPGLSTVIDFGQAKPVLAFWKLEPVPYVENPSGTEDLPEDCNAFSDSIEVNPNKSTCQALLISRNSYTLVVYSLRTDNPSGETWEGPGRLVRYELRQYRNLSTLEQTPGYCDPAQLVSPTSWPKDKKGEAPKGCGSKPAYSEQVLVDLVDNTTTPAASCSSLGSDYSSSIPDSMTSFYACVKRPLDASGNVQLQDIFLSLRGNAIKRAGASLYTDPSFTPIVQAQVKIRSALNREPSQLPPK